MDRKSSKYLGRDTNKSSDASVTSQLWNLPSFGLRDMMKAQEREKERAKLSAPTQLWIGSIEVSQSGKEIQELVKYKPYSLREIIKDREGEHANSNNTPQIFEMRPFEFPELRNTRRQASKLDDFRQKGEDSERKMASSSSYPDNAGKAGISKEGDVQRRDALSARDSQIGIQPVSSNDAGKGGNDGQDSKDKMPLVEKSYRDVMVSGTSNKRSKAGRNIIEKTIEEERQSDAQRSQEHETKSASSVIRSRIHEISINKINEENVQNHLNKVYDISNEIDNIDPRSVNSIEQKERHTRVLRGSHMQLKTFMIESHDLYQRYEQSKQNKTQIENKEEFDYFVKKLVETEKKILYKYDLDYSLEEKSEYDKAVLTSISRNTWYNMYPKFKCDIERSTPEIKKEKLENLISNYKSTINQIREYQELDRSSPKEAALQRLEYSYLKGTLKALNLIWQDVLQIKEIKGDIPREFLSEYKRLEKGALKFRKAVL